MFNLLGFLFILLWKSVMLNGCHSFCVFVDIAYQLVNSIANIDILYFAVGVNSLTERTTKEK